MSNKVWVKWKFSDGSSEEYYCCQVIRLADDANVDDLRLSFVEQQHLNVSPARVVVRETQGGEMPKLSSSLTKYFVPPADSAATPGPGKSEETPLFLTLPPPHSNTQQQGGERTVSCRLWVGEDLTVYDVPAPTFESLSHNVVARFGLQGDQDISFYYIPNKNYVASRRYVANDGDLHIFLAVAGKPIIFVWLRGDPSLSPQSIPSQLELQHAGLSDGESMSSSSGRSYPQELFRTAVRKRDQHKCVLTGTQLRPKTGNVEAAHLFGVERSLTQARQDAGIWNAYDTMNGVLLESSLHTDFDSYFWCMDEFLNVHVSEAGKGMGLGHLEGRKLNLRVDDQGYPTRRILRARYDLFLKKVQARESSNDPKKRRRKYITAFTV